MSEDAWTFAPDLDANARMRDLRLRFVERSLADTIILERFLARPPGQTGDVEALASIGHRISGLAGAFEYGELGAAAEALEVAAKSDAEDSGTAWACRMLIEQIQSLAGSERAGEDTRLLGQGGASRTGPGLRTSRRVASCGARPGQNGPLWIF